MSCVSFGDIDALCEEVRRECAVRFSSPEPQPAAAGGRGGEGDATKLVLGTLNVSEHLPLPLELYPGGRQFSDYTPIPESLYDEGHVWRVTKKFFSTGVCEVRAVLGGSSIRKPAKLSEPSNIDTSESAQNERFMSSIRRSRRRLRDASYELGADHMITLGRRGKFESIDFFWKCWDRFNRLCSKRFSSWKAVVVPELHADGETYHAHVAVRGWYSIEALRICWYKALGGKGNERGESTPGSVNIKSFKRGRKGGGGAASVRAIAGYIGKYVGKGFAPCNRGRRFFAASRGLNTYRVERWRVDFFGSPAALAYALIGRIVGAGGSGMAEYFRWQRARADGSLMMTGFNLTTDWREVL